MTRGRALIAAALVLSLALVGVYAAAGGASYEPVQVRNPCEPRPEYENSGGLEGLAEEFTLSALDGAACKLHVTREDMVLAFSSRASLARFARQHHVSTQQLDELVRAGLMRSIDDAENAGALNPTIADLLRGFVRRFPIEQLIELLRQLPGF